MKQHVTKEVWCFFALYNKRQTPNSYCTFQINPLWTWNFVHLSLLTITYQSLMSSKSRGYSTKYCKWQRLKRYHIHQNKSRFNPSIPIHEVKPHIHAHAVCNNHHLFPLRFVEKFYFSLQDKGRISPCTVHLCNDVDVHHVLSVSFEPE